MKGESFQIVSWFQSWSSPTGLVGCAGETIHKSNHAAATPNSARRHAKFERDNLEKQRRDQQ